MITTAVYSSVAGRIVVTGDEALTLLDSSTVPWTVTFNGVPQTVTGVVQSGASIRLNLATGGSGDIRLSYAGGSFVQGSVSGLFLQPVSNFAVTM